MSKQLRSGDMSADLLLKFKSDLNKRQQGDDWLEDSL